MTGALSVDVKLIVVGISIRQQMLSIETDTNLVVIGVSFGNYVVSAWLSHGVHRLFEGID